MMVLPTLALGEVITEDFSDDPNVRGWVDHIEADNNLYYGGGYVRSDNISREVEDAFYVPLSQNYTEDTALSAKFSINLIQDHIASQEIFRVGFFNKDEWFDDTANPDTYDAENTVDAAFQKLGTDPNYKGSLRATCLPDGSDYLFERVESVQANIEAAGTQYFLLTYTPGTGANSAGQVAVSLYPDNTYGTATWTATADLEIGDTFNINAFGIFTGHLTSNTGAMQPVLDNVEIIMTAVEPVCGDSYHPRPAGDITGPEGVPDCIVDMLDFAAMSGSWFECTDPVCD